MISEATVSEPLDAGSRGGAFDFRTSRPKSRGPTWLSARSGWLGLSGVIAGALLIALSAARTNVLLPESVRPVPGWLAGVFGRGVLDLGLGWPDRGAGPDVRLLHGGDPVRGPAFRASGADRRRRSARAGVARTAALLD